MQICLIIPVLTPGRYCSHYYARTSSLQQSGQLIQQSAAEFYKAERLKTQLLPQQAVAVWVYRSVVGQQLITNNLFVIPQKK